jgi:glutaredoxin
MVLLYSLSTCSYCKKVKQLFAEREIDYDYIDVDLAKGPAQELALMEIQELTGRRSFPVTIINDNVIIGYQPEKILEALRDG